MIRSIVLSLPFVLCAFSQEKALPDLNRRIVEQVRSLEGQKVGRGECWDLAAQVLNDNSAKWDGLYGFGQLVDWRKNEVLPGDIVQFEGVSVERRTENSIHRESFMHHTAVVLAVNGTGAFTLAHQNFGPSGRKVSFHDLSMAEVRSGKVTFYRPE